MIWVSIFVIFIDLTIFCWLARNQLSHLLAGRTLFEGMVQGSEHDSVDAMSDVVFAQPNIFNILQTSL